MKSPGGFSSIKYSMKIAHAVGLNKFIKTVASKNACKSCALGTGGQLGGMRTETGAFPEVCKKGLQTQLTDIQDEIPLSLFENNNIDALKEIMPQKLERLGRLNHPLYKANGAKNYSPISWSDAIDKIAGKLKSTKPDRSFFYSSGRSSNEAAFVLQLLARLYGTNNINNCAYYCHQASGVGMNRALGVGTATILLADLKNCDQVFVIGANPPSNHPRFMTELMNCRQRGGEIVVINPAKEPGLISFAIPSRLSSMARGGSLIASQYVQPNIGGDVALLKGIAKFVLEKGKTATDFIANHTNRFDEYKEDILLTGWESITQLSGVAKSEIEKIANSYISSNATVFAWAMGITQHDHGVENVESIVNLALLRGMVGKPNSGLLPLRGHSNVQGVGSVGVTPSLKDYAFKALKAMAGGDLPIAPGMDTMACMHASAKGEIDFAFLLGGNLYAANPDPLYAEQALNKIPFKVFLSTTLNQGHLFGIEGEAIILPVVARDEEKQSTTQESMFNYVRLSDGGITRLDNTRPETEIICDIAIEALDEAKIDFSKFKSHQNIREAIARAIPGFEKLSAIGETYEEFQVGDRTFHEPIFATEDKRANFIVVPTPRLKGGAGQFRLMTVRSEGQFNSIIYEEEDIFRDQPGRWIVLMNEVDMTSLGLKENDLVTLESETGKMENVLARKFDVAKGNLMAYYPEANCLVSTKTDSRSKTPSFKSVAVKVIVQ